MTNEDWKDEIMAETYGPASDCNNQETNDLVIQLRLVARKVAALDGSASDGLVERINEAADHILILTEALKRIIFDAPTKPVFTSDKEYSCEDGAEFYGRDSVHYMLAEIARKALR